jgi:hypothetical protein
MSYLLHFRSCEATSFNFWHFSFASWLMRCMLLISDYQQSEVQVPLQKASTVDNINKGENATKTDDISSKTNIERTVSNKVSPAKLAQVERESSTESNGSSESSDEGEAVVERSRAIVRSASPRRSASPMRRVQIGRSGSRRSTAIAIKSLSYFPPSQRIPLDNNDETSTCNGETDQPPRNPDNNVRRMSVQDAISLFENKQNDQNPDSQKQKAGLFATKSVLRRWSAGMGDSLNNKSEQKISDSTSENKSNNMASNTENNQVEMKAEPDRSPNSVITPEVDGLATRAVCHDMKGTEMESEMPSDTYAVQTKSGLEQSSGRAMTSAEWNHQKEAELNQMLIKMMEVMPGKANITSSGIKATNQKKDGSHREKPEAKSQIEKGVRRTAKEVSTKLSKESVGLNKSAITSKTGTITEKRISPAPQRARRNSSPPVLPKEMASKTPARKSSPKTSPAPATRSSWSGGFLTKSTTSTAQKTKSPAAMASTSTPTSRRRTTAAPSSSQPTSKMERTLQPGKKETAMATKPTIKRPEENKAKTATRTSRIAKISPASEEKPSASMKQSLHNKVSKKSSVVPLESKPLKKATGISQSVGSAPAKPSLAPAKSKVAQPDDSSKDNGSVDQAEDKEQTSVTTEPTTKVLEADLAQPAHDVDEHLEFSLNNDLNIEKTEKPASSLIATEIDSSDQVEPCTSSPAPPPDEDMDISSAAWVEVENQEQEVTDAIDENVVAEDEMSQGIAPLPSSSPRIHHSLSQMLQADNNEPEIIEWGNAENPPAIVFHKDSSKGFKRLLKFARKNKGDNNTNGWASPSVVSEGEDEFDESGGTGDGANSSRRTFDGSKTNSIVSGTSLNHDQEDSSIFSVTFIGSL